MSAWYDENGTRVVQNTYDEMDRVTAQTDANGATVTLAYGDGFTTATDALGYETTYYYDAMKRDYPYCLPGWDGRSLCLR